MKPRLHFATLLLVLCGVASAANGEWKYKYVAVVVQNSGAIRQNGQVMVEVLNRLAANKPAGVSMGMFGFEQQFKQLDEGRFMRRTTRLLSDTGDAAEIREAARELVFTGPSPVYDALADALDAAAERQPATVLLISNAIDNASDVDFEDMVRRAEKTGVPILAFYFPSNPPMNGDSRMRRLAKASNGRFIDLRLKDSWEQLLAGLQ